MNPTTPPCPGDLRKFPALAYFGPEPLKTLAALGQVRAVGAESFLFREGEEGRHPFLVLAGSVEARRTTPRRDLRLDLLGPGDLLGEVAFLDGGHREYTARASSPCEILEWDAVGLSGVVEYDPVLATALLRAFWCSLSQKIRVANGVMSSIWEAATPAPSQRRSGSASPARLPDLVKRLTLMKLGFSSDETDLIAAHVEALSYQSGALLFAEGEPGDALFVVLEGKVRISRRIPGAGEEALSILGKGEVFGEMALIDDQPRSADALAQPGGCAVLPIGRALVEQVLSAGPTDFHPFLEVLDRMLCRKLRNMIELLVAWRTMAGFG